MITEIFHSLFHGGKVKVATMGRKKVGTERRRSKKGKEKRVGRKTGKEK